jgi:hypothetical protein
MPYFGSGSSIECPPTMAAQDLSQHVRAERRQRVGHQVERSDRPSAHRVDVRQGVGGGDPAEGVRVVDDRREEVDGLHDRQVGGELHHAGVVGGVGGDQHARVCRSRERGHDRAQVGGGQLAAASRSVRQRRQGGAHRLL